MHVSLTMNHSSAKMADTMFAVEHTIDRTPEPGHALTPPTSEEWNKSAASPECAYSDADCNDEDIGEIEPAFYYDGGKIPVFKPTMPQFQSFSKFIAKVNNYGMKAGIIKVIPPVEWREALPPLDEAVKTIKIKNPIAQDFAGTHGTYTQANIEKQRSYNLPQWKALAEEPQHQPPAKRGERRQGQLRQTASGRQSRRSLGASDSLASPLPRRGPGRPKKQPRLQPAKCIEPHPDFVDPLDTRLMPAGHRSPIALTEQAQLAAGHGLPSTAIDDHGTNTFDTAVASEPVNVRAESSQPRSNGKAKSVSERRKYNQRELAEKIDETAFKGFDYRIQTQEEYTPERCAELETAYWKSLTFAAPMYAADMPGSLFPESTQSWNVAKLDNLLDVIGQKVPGVNTAYLYLGMWKATFAWHLEDVDLYSINYIHFGAPKQWYSISQEDARRFESAMKSIWPSDAKNCSQFLRHKTYLVSPSLLQTQYNIRVNKLVHYEGEFVITFPYGYHSGYNIGYNCAESVNFATEEWLEYGKIAKKCNCEADSVWIDAHHIERRLRGEPSPEYFEDSDDDMGQRNVNLPSPPASVKGTSRKRKRGIETPFLRQSRSRGKRSTNEPCALCPSDLPATDLLPTDDGRHAHRICAEFTPETYIWLMEGVPTVCDMNKISKARIDLKCSFCRSKKGACIQCSHKKCTRAFHATCAAPAGVRVDTGRTPQYLPGDSTEYFIEDNDFRCRFHRNRRPKTHDPEALEKQHSVYSHAAWLGKDTIVQIQYYNTDIFAGVVLENRITEQTLVVQVLQNGDILEVDWKWILTHEEIDSQLVKASPNARPLPADVDKDTIQTRSDDGPPRPDDPFCDPTDLHRWQEFHCVTIPQNLSQKRVDFAQDLPIWHYLGAASTQSYDRYTEDPSHPRPNPASSFLGSVAGPLSNTVPAAPSRDLFVDASSAHLAGSGQLKTDKAASLLTQPGMQLGVRRPYNYKPRSINAAQPPGVSSEESAIACSNTSMSTNSCVLSHERLSISHELSDARAKHQALLSITSHFCDSSQTSLPGTSDTYSSVENQRSAQTMRRPWDPSLGRILTGEKTSDIRKDQEPDGAVPSHSLNAEPSTATPKNPVNDISVDQQSQSYLFHAMKKKEAYQSPYDSVGNICLRWLDRHLPGAGSPTSNGGLSDPSHHTQITAAQVEASTTAESQYSHPSDQAIFSSAFARVPSADRGHLKGSPPRPPVSPIMQYDI